MNFLKNVFVFVSLLGWSIGSASAAEATTQYQLQIAKMTCEGCATSVSTSFLELKSQSGEKLVKNCVVDVAKGEAQLTMLPGKSLSASLAKETIESLGYELTAFSPGGAQSP